MFLFVTKSEQSQEIHTTKTDARSARWYAGKPLFYRPDKPSGLFGIRNTPRALIILHISTAKCRAPLVSFPHFKFGGNRCCRLVKAFARCARNLASPCVMSKTRVR